jgi:NADPH:quinone reductase-like Zn-dependent oxidoreductase
VNGISPPDPLIPSIIMFCCRKLYIFGCRLSNDFRAATEVVQERVPHLKSGQVLVRRAFAGVNASDVNFTSGRYFGSPEQSAKLLPFDAGFEAVGVVAAVGADVKGANPTYT